MEVVWCDYKNMLPKKIVHWLHIVILNSIHLFILHGLESIVQ